MVCNDFNTSDGVPTRWSAGRESGPAPRHSRNGCAQNATYNILKCQSCKQNDMSHTFILSFSLFHRGGPHPATSWCGVAICKIDRILKQAPYISLTLISASGFGLQSWPPWKKCLTTCSPQQSTEMVEHAQTSKRQQITTQPHRFAPDFRLWRRFASAAPLKRSG